MDPTGEIVGFIIAGAIIGAYIGGSIAEGTMNPGAWAWDNNTWKGIAIGGVAGAATGALVGTMWAAGATVTIGGQLGANTVPLVSFSKAGFSTANTVAGLIGGAGATGVAAASINWSAVDFARQQEIEQNQSRSKRGTVTVDPLIYNGWENAPVNTSTYDLNAPKFSGSFLDWVNKINHGGNRQWTDPYSGQSFLIDNDGDVKGFYPRTGIAPAPSIRGAYSVYQGIKNGKIVYWGLTKNITQRTAQHGSRFQVRPIYENLTRSQARGLEQLMIDKFGIEALQNIRNGVGINNPRMMMYYREAIRYLKGL